MSYYIVWLFSGKPVYVETDDIDQWMIDNLQYAQSTESIEEIELEEYEEATR